MLWLILWTVWPINDHGLDQLTNIEICYFNLSQAHKYLDSWLLLHVNVDQFNKKLIILVFKHNRHVILILQIKQSLRLLRIYIQWIFSYL